MALRLATRAAALPASGIRAVMAASRGMEGCIHLEVGQPNFKPEQSILVAAAESLSQTEYTPNNGLELLRAAAGTFFSKTTSGCAEADNIIVTHGAVMSCATSAFALIDPGEEILVPDPGWPNYEMAIKLAEGVPVRYPMYPKDEFVPKMETLEALVSPRTKAILINSPSNPTGQVFDKDTIRNLIGFARANNLWVISDEIYGCITFGNKPYTSVLGLDDDRCIVISGVSKAYAMTGFRIGFMHGPKDFIDVATKLQEAFVSCSPMFTQFAAAAALNGPMDHVNEMRQAYERRRDMALEILRKYGLYTYTPKGAFYVLVDISASGLPAMDFCQMLLREHKVAVAPGDTFGDVSKGYVRVSFSASDEHVYQGVTLLAKTLAECKREGKGARS